MTSAACTSHTSSLPEKNPVRDAETPFDSDRVDRRLVQGCAQSDAAALRELVQRYQQRLQRFLVPVLGSPEDAEEVALDVFLRIWQQAHRFEGRASVATWLFRIASNAACDRLRRRKGQTQAVPLADVPEGRLISAESANAEDTALNRLEQEERSQQLQTALQTLRVEECLLLSLYYQEELSYQEIGQITRLPTSVLKMRLLRARRRLRTLLEAQMASSQTSEESK